jgi:hypothetical protein
VSWDPSPDYNFDHYEIYVGEESGIYIREETTKQTSYLIDQLTSGKKYFIGLSVVDSDGYESLIRERSFIPFDFTRDQGILVIDETADGDGSYLKPSDDQVDQFYETLLEHFEVSNWDIIDNRGISLTDFGAYSTIIWQADDSVNLTTLDSILSELGRFLDAGGNLLYTGYMPCQAIQGTFAYPDTFTTGDFVYDYLKIANTEKGFGTRFYGATAEITEYSDIFVDTIKTEDFSDKHLRDIESITPTDQGREIFSYYSKFDSSSAKGRMTGEPVGVEYIGEDYKTITLTFPLYYMQEDQAKYVLEYILSEKFSEPLVLPNFPEHAPQVYELHQNYPNPFNPTTTITWHLAASGYVDLSIFNILGETVATLVSEYQSPGHHSVEWDASGFASGVYYYRLETKKGFVKTKKMILLR